MPARSKLIDHHDKIVAWRKIGLTLKQIQENLKDIGTDVSYRAVVFYVVSRSIELGPVAEWRTDPQKSETKGAETKGAETKGAETKGAETKGAETKGAETKEGAKDPSGTPAAKPERPLTRSQEVARELKKKREAAAKAQEGQLTREEVERQIEEEKEANRRRVRGQDSS